MLTRDQLARLCAARDVLQDLSRSELSIDDVARDAAMSRFHFVRQFKSLFGVTPVECRTRARLSRAKHLLSHSDASITDICLAIGFSSLGSFSTLFAARIGLSPSAYREQHKDAPERDAPACMQLLQAVWARESQISRSDNVSGSAKLE